MRFTRCKDLPNTTTPYPAVKEKKILVAKGEVRNLHQFGRVVFQEGQAVTPHSHDDFTEVMYVESGSAHMKIADTSFDIQEGDCITVEPQEVHEILVDTGKSLTMFFFGIYK